MDRLTANTIRMYQIRKDTATTIGEFKELGRELRDRFGLTDREAIDLLNGRNEIDVLANYESKTVLD